MPDLPAVRVKPLLPWIDENEYKVNAAGCVRYKDLGVINIQALPRDITVFGTIRKKTNCKVATCAIQTNLT